MKNQSDVTYGEDITSVRSICWSAIFAGAFTGLGLGFLLQLYSIAIGLSAYSSSSSSGTAIAVGGFLGLLVGVIAAMIAAGFVAGHLGRFHYGHCHGGIIYGFLTWSMTLVLSAVMLFPFTHYSTSYTKSLSPNVEVTNALSQPIEVRPNANAKSDTADARPSVKVTPTALTGSSWILFLLFFVGAISCCVGACWGMVNKRDCCVKEDHKHSTARLG